MNKLWKMFECSVKWFFSRVLRRQLSKEQQEKLFQFIKFGVVGVSNTLISYVIYVMLIAFHVHYLLASTAGFLVSVINAYYWNNKYVFQAGAGEKRAWWSVFLKTFVSYAGTGLVLNNILLILWVNVLGWPEIIGPVINLLITIPLNFALNKFWAYRKKEEG